MMTIVSETVNEKVQLGAPQKPDPVQTDYNDQLRQSITKSTSGRIYDIKVNDFHSHEIQRR